MATFHIAGCRSPVCKERLKTLSGHLQVKGYTVLSTIFAGSRKKHFLECLSQCSLTILHKCPEFWNFVEKANLDEFLKDNEEFYLKVLCVEFENQKYRDLISDEHSFLRFDTFYEDLSLYDISNETSLLIFIQDIQHLLGAKAEHVVRSPTGVVSSRFNVSARRHLPSSADTKEKEYLKKLHLLREKQVKRSSLDDGSLVLYPSQLATVKAFAKVMNGSKESTTLINISSVTTFEELRIHINQMLRTSDTALCNIHFLLNKVMPVLYEDAMLHGLVEISSCDEPSLQKHALDCIELLMFKGTLHAPTTDIDMLLTLKMIFIDSIDSMRQNKTQDNQLESLIARKCLLLYYVQMEILLKSTKHEDFDNRNLKQKPEEQSSHIDRCVTSTYLFISLKLPEVKQFLQDSKTLSGRTASDVYNLIGQKEHYQFYIIVQLITKIFKGKQDEDVLCLDYLETYLKIKLTITRRCMPFICLHLIQRGILQFLAFLSKESANKNLVLLCSKSLKLVPLLKKSCYFKENVTPLKTLLFCHNDQIRLPVIQFFTENAEFNSPIEKHIVHIVEEMFPALTIDQEDKVTLKLKDDWLQIPGHFMNSTVGLFIHKPSEDDHKRHNKTDFKSHKDLTKLKNVSMLRQLTHEKIRTLYAFNIKSIPEFYIMESHWEKQCRNLQNYLVNRSIQKNWCVMSTLMKFLFEAASAVEFCHLKDIILRDITAASFIVTKDNTVKLARFDLAIQLERKSIIVDEIGDQFLMPTRWSAPESLWHYIWSKASDVWMFGHLMYEILSHGVEPYSYLDINDSDFKLRLRFSGIKLKQEDCFLVEHYDILQQCTRYSDKARLNMSKLKHLLTRQKKQFIKHSDKAFPSLADRLNKPSIKFSKGNPKILLNEFAEVKFQYHRDLSGNLKQYISLKENRHLFHQRVQREFSKELLEQIRKGALDEFFPILDFVKLKEDLYDINVRIPQHLEGNVLELVYNKTLGSSSPCFKALLLKIAKLLHGLHQVNFALGNIRASQMFVHRTSNNDYQVYPVSASALQYCSMSYTEAAHPDRTDVVLMARSAPEVYREGKMSPASDAFGFGMVMLDLFHARTNVSQPDIVSTSQLLSNFDKLECQFDPMELQKPDKMEQKLFDVINDCLNTNAVLRPTLENIIKMLTPKEDFMFIGSEASDSKFLISPTYQSNSEMSTEPGSDITEQRILNMSEIGDYETYSNIYTEYFEPKSFVMPAPQDQNTCPAAVEVTSFVEDTDRSNGSYQDASTAPREMFSESDIDDQYHRTANNDYEGHTYQTFYAGSSVGAISAPPREDVIMRGISPYGPHSRPTAARSEFFDNTQAGASHERSQENVTNTTRRFQLLRPFQSSYMLHLTKTLSNEASAYDYMEE